MKLSMFRTPKPRQFNYKTIYSSEDKEEQKKVGDVNQHKFRGQFKKKSDIFEKRKSKQRRINILLYAIIAVLLLYLIFS